MSTVQVFDLPLTFAPPARPQYYPDVLGAIGHTPLIRLNRVLDGACAGLALAKVEFFNPAGSVKDRIGDAIILAAEREGRLRPGGTIVEATSGNTGAGLALAAAVRGYRCIFVMPDKMSEEKVRFLRAFGARVVITPTAVPPEDPRSYYSVAQRIAAETPNAILANQYHNPANPKAHYESTGPEIWEQTAGQIDVLVAGLGTGGTITGTGRFLKERNPGLKIVGVDILGSLLYAAWRQGGKMPNEPYLKTYKIEGIGEDFIPSTLDLSLIDEVVQVDDAASFQMTRRLVREEGLFCGGSSGSAVAGMLKSEVVRGMRPDQIAVVILPDGGSRYLSKIFDDNWMRENGFLASEQPPTKVGDVMKRHSSHSVVTAHPEDRMLDVVERLKTHDISQLPVVNEAGSLIGIVSEVDLLDHLLHADHIHDPAETIAPMINPNVATVSQDTDLNEVLPVFERGKVVVITRDDQPVGILTKIDVIDYLTRQVGRV
ncbi:MAG TPA: cystathionine beta-synthase [Anaerolineaceae bacterium]|nr:cystathionine beta-synthase [Anaerolineaceae bacterium]